MGCNPILEWLHCYHPQRSWGKVMFLHVSVILFTGGVCLSACWDTTPPRPRTPPLGADTPPPEQCMLGDTDNKWVVRFLLECILVFNENRIARISTELS